MDLKFIKLIRVFTWIAPLLVIVGIMTQMKWVENKGEYPNVDYFLLFIVLMMLTNVISIVVLSYIDYKNKRKNNWKFKLLKTFSILFGTPVIIILWLLYLITLNMNYIFYKPEYLRTECFVKLKNIYKAKNTYHYSSGYCPTANQDSVIVAEIYRWGSIKSCQIILDGKHTQIDTSEITFLTMDQKNEILSY